MKIQLIVALMLLPCLVQAELFKWEDASGNIIYSDQPPPGAEKEEHQVDKESLPPIISVPAVETVPAEPVEEVLESMERYKSLAVVFPEHDTSLRENAGNVLIKVAIEPYLFNERGDLLVIYMDDQEISRGRDTSIQLVEVDRGTHTVKAKIIDDKGHTVKESQMISFTLQRHSRLFRAN